MTFKINDLMIDVLSTDMKAGDKDKDKGCGPCTKCTKCTDRTGPPSGCTDTHAVHDCCGPQQGERLDANDIVALRAQLRALIDAQAA